MTSMAAGAITQPFRWRNCYADVLSNRNGQMARAYIRDVVEPSVSAMEGQISNMRGRQDDPVAVFGIGPAEAVLRATLLGYCLSIQAMWEKQIRDYLAGCARELQADPRIVQKIPNAKWPELDAIFKAVRGVPLAAFEEYAVLNKLQLLGNVCRHGNGPSLDRLAVEYPELWPAAPTPQFAPPPPFAPPQEPARAAENVHVSLDLLRSFAGSIDSFWRETEYIYNESIHPKHASLEAVLREERRVRAGRGRPWDPPP